MKKLDLSHEEQKFKTQLEVSSTIQRSDEKGEYVEKANQMLLNLGGGLNPLPDNMKHLGSGAFHVYYNETLKQLMVVSQTTPLKYANKHLAKAALRDFNGAVIEFFDGRRPKMRNGF